MMESEWQEGLKKEISRLVHKLTHSKDLFLQTWIDSQHLQDKIEPVEDLFVQLDTKIQGLEEECKQLTLQSERYRKRIYQLEEQLELAHQSESVVRQDYETLWQTKKAETKRRKEFEVKQEQLEDELNCERLRTERAVREKDILVIKIQELQLEIEKLKNATRTKETEIHWLQNDFRELEESRNILLQEWSTAKHELKDYRKWKQQFEDNYKDIQSRMEHLLKEIERLELRYTNKAKEETDSTTSEQAVESALHENMSRMTTKDDKKVRKCISSGESLSTQDKVERLVKRVSSLSLEDESKVSCQSCEQWKREIQRVETRNEELSKRLNKAKESIEYLLTSFEENESLELLSVRNALHETLLTMKAAN